MDGVAGADAGAAGAMLPVPGAGAGDVLVLPPAAAEVSWEQLRGMAGGLEVRLDTWAAVIQNKLNTLVTRVDQINTGAAEVERREIELRERVVSTGVELGRLSQDTIAAVLAGDAEMKRLASGVMQTAGFTAAVRDSVQNDILTVVKQAEQEFRGQQMATAAAVQALADQIKCSRRRSTRSQFSLLNTSYHNNNNNNNYQNSDNNHNNHNHCCRHNNSNNYNNNNNRNQYNNNNNNHHKPQEEEPQQEEEEEDSRIRGRSSRNSKQQEGVEEQGGVEEQQLQEGAGEG